MNINLSDKIYVAGHRGLVGQAIIRNLQARGYEKLLFKTRQELDLSQREDVHRFIQAEKPDVIFIAAARVGGINANNSFRADFIHENLLIQNNLIWGAHLANVRRVVFLGSSCIYPKNAPQPMPESSLLSGFLEQTNRPYAIAKIAGLELIDGLRKQYSRDYLSVMPTNLYGVGDSFDLENSHVLPALIRKIVEAKDENRAAVEIWGTGAPLREFMFADDCADAIVEIAEKCSFEYFDDFGYSYINIGSGQEISIKDLAAMIAELTGYKGRLQFNTDRPDGSPRKLLATDQLSKLGWKPKYSLHQGIQTTIDWYRSQQNLGK